MSWHVSLIGKPEAVVRALKARSATLTGQSKVEYDDALPHLCALVEQTFSVEASGAAVPILSLVVSGSGSTQNGVQAYRTCQVKIDTVHSDFVT